MINIIINEIIIFMINIIIMINIIMIINKQSNKLNNV